MSAQPSRITNFQRAMGVQPTMITCRFWPNGNSTDPLKFIGMGVASVVRTATAGLFTITYQNAYKNVLGVSATIQNAASADRFAAVRDIANEDSTDPLTVQVEIFDGASATDPAADDDSSVTVVLFADLSSSHPGAQNA